MDLEGTDSIITFEAVRDMQVEASFLAIPSADTSTGKVIKGAVQVLEKMDNLTEVEKRKNH